MKKEYLSLFLGITLFGLAACGGTPTPLPPTQTAVPPTETVNVEVIAETAVPPTPTNEPIPTEAEPTSEALFPTPEVTATPTLTPTAEMPNYAITIAEPVTASTLLAGTEVTVRGNVQPPTTDPISITVTIGSFTAVSAQVVPDGTTGNWQVTAPVADTVSGPGLLTAALGRLTQTDQPIQIAFDRSSEEPYLALSRPVQGETAVAGHAFLLQGDSNNLIADAFTIGVMVDGCSNFIAAQKISLTGGIWFGFVILPQNAAAGPACAVAYTGEYKADDWREVQIPIQLRAFDDTQAVLLDLGNLGELTFARGEMTNLFGVAVNLPDRAVNIELVLDSASSGSQLIATGKAFADQFGFWSIDLAIPDDAPNGLGLLTISGGEEENYQEIRQTVTISP
ncbi:hypothetical protein MNBD_CHLOROFLEXI01-661 [hydrothermal vent metagenome]|uniref:Uncharacterized protein n=1 Tax=hydrothermal vent metagenome TaxID=652676 RepID=A0A3B0VEA4_9ZZZZ